tara:strand:+ start:502 stop:1449 length:948 start_codon:yes stop_codon:yes gene_type:complete
MVNYKIIIYIYMKNYIYLLIVFIIFLCICLVCKGCINIYERLTISGNGDEKCNNINISQNITLNNVCNCKSNENICPQKIPIEYCRQYNNNKSECESAYSLGKNCNCGLDPETYYRCTWDKAYNDVNSQCSYYKRGGTTKDTISCKRTKTKYNFPSNFKLMGNDIGSQRKEKKLLLLLNKYGDKIDPSNINNYNYFYINKVYEYYFMELYDFTKPQNFFAVYLLDNNKELKVFNDGIVKKDNYTHYATLIPWVKDIIVNINNVPITSNKYLHIYLIDSIYNRNIYNITYYEIINKNYKAGYFNGYTIVLDQPKRL